MSDTNDPMGELHNPEIIAFANKWAVHFSKHGTGYFEHSERDMAFVRDLEQLLAAQDIASRIDELESLSRIYGENVRPVIQLDLKERIAELQAKWSSNLI